MEVKRNKNEGKMDDAQCDCLLEKKVCCPGFIAWLPSNEITCCSLTAVIMNKTIAGLKNCVAFVKPSISAALFF